MDFAKGAIMGIIAGTVVGVMNSSNIIEMFQQGKKQLKNKCSLCILRCFDTFHVAGLLLQCPRW